MYDLGCGKTTLLDLLTGRRRKGGFQVRNETLVILRYFLHHNNYIYNNREAFL